MVLPRCSTTSSPRTRAGARDRLRQRHLRGVQRHPGRRAAGATSPTPACRSTRGASTRPRWPATSRSSATGRAVRHLHQPGASTPAPSPRPPRSARSATASRRTRRSAPGHGESGREVQRGHGQEVGYINDEMAFGLPNGVGPEVTAMREAGVDFIYGCLDLNGMKTVAQELERQGMGDVHMLPPEHLRRGVRGRGRRAVRGRHRRRQLPALRGRPRRQPARPTSRSGWTRRAARSPSWP